MKTYKPEKKTTPVIMMGTNDLRAREYDKCINNFQELAKMTPPDTLVVQIPPQHHETDGFEKERSDMNRKLANQVITKRPYSPVKTWSQHHRGTNSEKDKKNRISDEQSATKQPTSPHHRLLRQNQMRPHHNGPPSYLLPNSG